MKIAIRGKGGVGKTTFAAVLAGLYASEDRKVLAVDADPDANLGPALGFSSEEMAEITPLSEMRTLIAERTGADESGMGKFFKINPKVDDLPDRYAREKNGVRLLLMGTVETGGGGCVCPEHVILRRVVSHLVVGRSDVVILDMEAGLEHLGRGTADMVDAFIAVVEPGTRSIQTYEKIKSLAADLGVKNVQVVGNKIRGEEDRQFIKTRIPEADLLGFLPYSEEVINADKEGASPFLHGKAVTAEAKKIKERMEHEKAI